MYEGCLVSHEHRDHARGIQGVAKSGINVYTTAGTLKALKIDTYSGNYNLIKYGKPYDIGSFIVYPFRTHHDAIEPAGFLIQSVYSGERLVFATDTSYLLYTFIGVDYIMIECNYKKEILAQNTDRYSEALANRITTNHFEIEEVKTWLSEMNLKKTLEIHLLHLSRNNADPDLFVKEIEKFTGVPTFTKEWN